MRSLRSGDGPFVQLRAVGGAVNDVDPAATAYAHRHQNFSVNAVGSRLEPAQPALGRDVAPHTDGLYLSFDTDPRPGAAARRLPRARRSTRLRALKAVYDPDNVFDQNFPIPPAECVFALVAGAGGAT